MEATNSAYGVWAAEPIEDDGEQIGWLPWIPWTGWQTRLTSREAHQIARLERMVRPGWLFAVRELADDGPLWAEGMPDHYDLEPYV